MMLLCLRTKPTMAERSGAGRAATESTDSVRTRSDRGNCWNTRSCGFVCTLGCTAFSFRRNGVAVDVVVMGARNWMRGTRKELGLAREIIRERMVCVRERFVLRLERGELSTSSNMYS